MALILCIETATKNCSVALSDKGAILAFREARSDQYIHSEKLHLFCKEVMQEAGKHLNDLDAIAIGIGPGSYTGLRIGLSAAKGFAFTLQIPLVSANSLEILAVGYLANNPLQVGELLFPMIDARRMEVYTAAFSSEGAAMEEVKALVIDENSLEAYEAKQLILIGDGAAKCKDVLEAKAVKIAEPIYPNAMMLSTLAQQKLTNGVIDDIAYLEPFYLKEFIAGKPKKLL